MSKWGEVRTIVGLRRQTRDVLQTWFPATLREVCRQEDFELLDTEIVRSWKTVGDPDTVADDQLPAIFVSSTGTPVEPEKRDGKFSVLWDITVTVFVRGQDHEHTADLVGLYVAAIVQVLVQHTSLEGYADGLWWRGVDFMWHSTRGSARTLGAGFADFQVLVNNVIDANAHPDDPDDTDDWAMASTLAIDLDNVPVHEELSA